MSNRKGFFESRNPVMKENAYMQASQENALTGGATMTVQGAINKSFILGLIMLATAAVAFTMPSSLLLWGGAIGGLVVVLIMSFRPALSPTLAPIYAGLEGLFVGAVSAIYASMFDGIIFQAVSLTFGVFFTMLFIFKSRIIKVDNKLRVGVMMATGAVALVYVVAIVMSMFGVTMPYLHQAGPIGIGISLVIIAIAAMNLLLDFDNFEKGEMYRAPKYMEWFSAMGLLVTLVWLYMEILRLLSILSRD